MCGERENGQLAWLSKSQSFNKPQIHTAQCQTHTNTRVEADTCTHSHTHTGQTVTSRKASPKSGTPRAGGAAGPTDASIPQGPPGLSGGLQPGAVQPITAQITHGLSQNPQCGQPGLGCLCLNPRGSLFGILWARMGHHTTLGQAREHSCCFQRALVSAVQRTHWRPSPSRSSADSCPGVSALSGPRPDSCQGPGRATDGGRR